MHIDKIRRLTRWMADAGLTSLELRETGFELRLARSGNRVAAVSAAPLPSVAETSSQAAHTLAVAAMAIRCGHFHARHPAREQPQFTPGQRVAVGDTVGVITVGGLLLPVIATQAGIAAHYLAEDGQLVDYGTPLLALAGE